jgi:hypothetical protein
MRSRRVERRVEGKGWEEVLFEDVRKGDVIRFFEGRECLPMEQNGCSSFLVVDKPRPVGEDGNCKVCVVPANSEGCGYVPVLSGCPYWGNIVVKPQGRDRLIEATGYCTECRYMDSCLKAKYSTAYFDQLGEALGLNDIWN